MSAPRDDYELLERISTGSVSSAYRGLQKNLERLVLVKILHPYLAADACLVSRFEREAKTCASLRHENIVSIFDFGEWEDSYFLATEWIEGISLARLLEKSRRLPLTIATEITKQLALGLGYAHAKGVIHRDIKPANVMIANEGVAKISDFGLAWAKGMPSITVEGTVVGTPAYMSPEQAQAKPLDKRTDIFSLGLVAYEMITGIVVYGAPTYSESITRVLTERVKPIRSIEPSVPPELESILTRMLQRDGRKRLDDCSRIIEAIETWAAASRPTLSRDEVAAFIAEPAVERVADVRATFRKGALRNVALASLAIVTIAAASFFGLRPPSGGDAPIVLQNRPEISQSEVDSVILSTSSGSVFLGSRPVGASIRLDGEWLEEKTPCVIADLPRGRHALLFDKPGFDSAVASVSVVAGRRTDLTLDLSRTKKGYGLVQFRVTPWAKVYVDGKYLDTTPVGREIRMQEGMHIVTLQNPAYPTFTETIHVSPDSMIDFFLDLEEETGLLKIAVHPWAELYIDGTKLGTTPFPEPIPLPAGTHEVSLLNPAFAPHVETLLIEPGATTEVLVRLESRE